MQTRFQAAAAAFFLFVSFCGPVQAAQLIMTDWRACPYCRQFNRDVAPSYGASEAGRQAPLRRVSVFNWPSDLAGVTPARQTPVFILVDNGREVGRFAGYTGQRGFYRRLERLLARMD